MEPTRRFNEHEIALIFERAGRLQEAERPEAGSEGLTLAQLREIAHDVGIDAAHLERAARDVATGDVRPVQRRMWFGLPVGVARTVEFERRLSDEEWTRLVVTLRETFEARGRLESEGPFRQWSNGNLQALLEPTPTGHRLRLSTRKGDAKVRVILGSAYLGLASLFAGLGALGAISEKAAVAAPLFLGAIGLVSLASAVVGLPRWASQRSRQMDAVAEHAARLAEHTATPA